MQMAVAGHPIAAVAPENAVVAFAVVAGAVAGAGWAIAADAAAVAVRSAAALAAEAHVMGCALVFVCRFALRRLVDC